MSEIGDPWTAKEEAVVLAMYINGTATGWETARAVETRPVSSSDVYAKAVKLRKRLGIKMVPRVPTKQVEDWDLVAALYDEHMSEHEIAAIFCVGADYVRSRLRQRGYQFQNNGVRKVGTKWVGGKYVRVSP